MIQKYVIGRWEIYICLLCNKKLAERREDGYLASWHSCEHYCWQSAVGKEAKKLKKQSLVSGRRDKIRYFLLSNID